LEKAHMTDTRSHVVTLSMRFSMRRAGELLQRWAYLSGFLQP
jgi:hypothetical protein